jgi:hypothetical protein
MSITTAQSISGALWNSGSIAGSIILLRELGPQSRVAPAGFTTQITGVNPVTPSIGNAGGINFVTAGFDPVVVATLQVVLRSTGQIWPVGFS